MFYRIDVDVIQMPSQIVIIANDMFPEPPLPDSTFTIASMVCDHASRT